MKLSLGFAAALLIGASTAVPALQSRQDACYTVHSGYFVVHPYSGDAGVTLNDQNQVVYGKPGKLLQVQFQACPKLLGNIPDDDKWVGRIVSGGRCLTITNANSTTEPYFAKVAGCSSNTSPSVAQTWKYGTGDDRGVVYWAGPPDSYGYVGYIPDDNGAPVVSSGGLLEIGCDHECINFSIRAELD
ncbi:hypothetical protein FRC04_007918 [Tulasnella sp. 424]|nr:hypothetical protein FRC04_007918 [Tulasnella sp. 424]KAG8959462.1 hypothetical protein FRC05_007727 [Tulasnella sp. 425]